MTEQDDVEVVREAFQRWNSGDIDYWIEHADPEVEMGSRSATMRSGSRRPMTGRSSGSIRS